MEDKLRWISAILLNDENSSDLELEQYFMQEGKMDLKEACFYVKQRNRALLDGLNFELEVFE